MTDGNTEPGHANGPSGPGGSAVDSSRVKSLACPSCGAAITMRGFAWTQSVACASCGTLLDARDPNLRVLQTFGRKAHVAPAIPLGSRGQWRGAQYEVIGFQIMKIEVDGVSYFWREYLLFNPYHGFRYLTEYDGHWNDVVPLGAVPQFSGLSGTGEAIVGGRRYKHFQTAKAETSYVLGEFPWEVRVGDHVTSSDYVDPPRVISSEGARDETTWSIGTYTDPAEIWRAFKAPGSPPPQRGIYANQPSPYAGSGVLWRHFVALTIVLAVLMLARLFSASNKVVHSGTYVLHRPDTANTVFVTPSFDLPGESGNVLVKASTDLDNAWVYLNYALVNEGTGEVFDFAREVSYYSGYDTDGRWSEGSPRDEATLGGIPGGRYFLRVEGDGPLDRGIAAGTLEVRRDVPSFMPFLLALLALVLPPAVLAIRSSAFEVKRWAESDHPIVQVSVGDAEGDDE